MCIAFITRNDNARKEQKVHNVKQVVSVDFLYSIVNNLYLYRVILKSIQWQHIHLHVIHWTCI